MLDDLNKSGIYFINCLSSSKIYIGATTKRFQKRKTEHFSNLRNGKYLNSEIQNDFNKYGEDKFIFGILEYIDSNEINLIEQREKYYIDKHKNILYNNNLHAQIPKINQRKKMSLSKKGNKNPIYGGHKEETKNKMSITRKEKEIVKGENNPKAKLSYEQFCEIKKLLKKKIKHQDIADMFSVSRLFIVRVNTGKHYFEQRWIKDNETKI